MNRHSVRRSLAWPAAASATVLLLASLLSWQHPAEANEPIIKMRGTAAASYINVLNGTATSGPTSESELETTVVGGSSTNQLALVDVKGVLRANTLSSEVTTSAIEGGTKITSTAQAAGVNLLNGAIKLDAVTTTSSVSLVNGTASTAGDTELVGLSINGKRFPINVKPNTAIKIPGLAEIVMNQTETTYTSDSHASVQSAGIKITLLKAVKNAPAGAIILLTPATAESGLNVPFEGPRLFGIGYALKASVKADDEITVLAGPIGRQFLQNGGTGGNEIERSIVGLNVPFAAKASVLGTTVEGSRRPEKSSGSVHAHAAKVNLFGGKVIVDVAEATAGTSLSMDDPQPTLTGSSRLVGLKLGGKAMPVDVPPNTKVDVLGLGTVTINQQVRNGNSILVRALDIKIDTKGLGVPVGAEIELSVAFIAATK